ncbi:HEAT repeat domain-containing protein [Microbacterium sp. 179-I 1D1 NHS]|uniref:HEAT repeat domain-containing protein n=1 Tax=Microbacterium sp. 179-I 1D1 NHS TaxID=3374298 RepID=UPI00387A5F44
MSETSAADRLEAALASMDPSSRVQAAMTAGTYPQPEYVPVLVAQCRIEPQFLVREMLTWALTRHDADEVIDRLLIELGSRGAQIRAQALHTMSKIGGPRVWPAITPDLLKDADDSVARVAWRTAARHVPVAEASALATTLATQFARGEDETRRSLSEAFATLGETARPQVDWALATGGPYTRAHAAVTARLMDDPEATYAEAVAAVADSA